MSVKNSYCVSMRSDGVVIATHNPIKAEEYNALLEETDISVRLLPETIEAPAESGKSFEANATIKAEYYSQQLPDQWVLADDSGILLMGQPDILGVKTKEELAIYPNNSAKNAHLIELADEYDGAFEMTSVIALAYEGGVRAIGRGKLHGYIASEERGTLSSGFDRILVPSDQTKTLAELPFEQRRKYLHRQRAINNLKSNIGGN